MVGKAGAGRRRLTIVLSIASGGTCAIAIGLVLYIYGAPYDPSWWWAMAAILAASFVAPAIVIVPAVEWVIVGYRDEGAPR